MAIIDHTYFIGKLNLPQTGDTLGRANVTQFIDIYEPELLKKVLGFDLWKAFINGIAGAGPIEQRWLDLLEGKEYTYHERNGRWLGFAPLTDGGSYIINTDNLAELTVGGPGAYDPVPGSAVMTLPPAFVPWVSTPLSSAYAIYLRGTGRLKSTEYSVVGDQLTLADGQLFNVEGVIFLEKGPRLSIIAGTTLKISPIANYVFYKFVEENAYSVAKIGTVTSETDNNRNVNPVSKLIDCWNSMVINFRDLFRFLEANRSTYPEWKASSVVGYSYFCNWWDSWHFNNCRNEVYQTKNSLDL